MTRRRLLLLAAPAAVMAVWLLAEWGWDAVIRHKPAYQNVSLELLGRFPFNDRTGTTADIPPEWRKLDSRRVALDGFMVPTTSAGPLAKQFQLVYDVSGHSPPHGPPLVQERVFGSSARPFSLHPTDEFVQVRGVLHVGVQKDTAGVITSVYQIDVESIEPAAEPADVGATSSVAGVTKWDLLALSYLLVGGYVLHAEWRQQRLRRRRAAGRCRACGYDLRATPEEGGALLERCPECGVEVRPVALQG